MQKVLPVVVRIHCLIMLVCALLIFPQLVKAQDGVLFKRVTWPTLCVNNTNSVQMSFSIEEALIVGKAYDKFVEGGTLLFVFPNGVTLDQDVEIGISNNNGNVRDSSPSKSTNGFSIRLTGVDNTTPKPDKLTFTFNVFAKSAISNGLIQAYYITSTSNEVLDSDQNDTFSQPLYINANGPSFTISSDKEQQGDEIMEGEVIRFCANTSNTTTFSPTYGLKKGSETTNTDDFEMLSANNSTGEYAFRLKNNEITASTTYTFSLTGTKGACTGPAVEYTFTGVPNTIKDNTTIAKGTWLKEDNVLCQGEENDAAWSFDIKESAKRTEVFKADDIIHIIMPSGFEIGNPNSVTVKRNNTDVGSNNMAVMANSVYVFVKTVESATNSDDVFTIGNLFFKATSANSTGNIQAYLIRNGVSTKLTEGTNDVLTLESGSIDFSLSSDKLSNQINEKEQLTFKATPMEAGSNYSYTFTVYKAGDLNTELKNIGTVKGNTFTTSTGAPADNYVIVASVKNTSTGCESKQSLKFYIVAPSIFKEVKNPSPVDLENEYCSEQTAQNVITIQFDADEIIKPSTNVTNVGAPQVYISDGTKDGDNLVYKQIGASHYSGSLYRFNVNLGDYIGKRVYLKAERTYTSGDMEACLDLCYRSYVDCKRSCNDIYKEEPTYPSNPTYPTKPTYPISEESSIQPAGVVGPQPLAMQDCYYCEVEYDNCRDRCSGSTSKAQKIDNFVVRLMPTATLKLDSAYCSSQENIPYSEIAEPSSEDRYGAFKVARIEGSNKIEVTNTGRVFTGIVFNPKELGEGTFEITYALTVGECVDSDVDTVTITKAPDAILESADAAKALEPQSGHCPGVGSIPLQVKVGAEIITPTPDQVSINPVVNKSYLKEEEGQVYLLLDSLNPGYSYTLAFTAPYQGGKCNITDNATVFVNPVPELILGINSGYCPSIDSVIITAKPNTNGSGVVTFHVKDQPTQVVSNSIKKWGDNFYLYPKKINPGDYEVFYTYTDKCVVVSDTLPVTIFPRAVSSFSISSTCAGEYTKFTPDVLSTGQDTTGWKFKWEFVDGNFISGAIAKRKFNSAVVSSVTLTVTTPDGCSTSTPKSFTIYPKPEVSFTTTGVCAGNTTYFVAKASVPKVEGVDDSTIESYTWDFGDGTVKTVYDASTVEHVYANPKERVVTLTVASNKGCTASVSEKIVIFPVIKKLVYNETFDGFNPSSNSNTWIRSVTSDTGVPSSWRLEQNDSLGLVWRTSGNNGSYYNSEQSYIESACIDFNIWDDGEPMMLLEYMSDTDLGADGAVLLYSYDGGPGWKILGSQPEAGINWYNKENILSIPGGEVNAANRIGWSGSSNGFKEARFSLDNIKMELANTPTSSKLVRFRLAFNSNSDNPVRESNFAGFALNKVQISKKNRKVLFEHFSNTETASIFTHTQEMIRFTKPREDVVYLEYHLGLPRTANEDPFWAADKGPQNGRAFRYGIGQAPATMVDGLYLNQQQESFLPKESEAYNKKGQTNYLRRTLVPSPFDMKIDYEGGEDNTPLKVKVTVKHSKDIAATPIVKGPLYVTIAIVENVIDHNGKQLRHVFRKFLPDAAGTHFKGDWSAEEAREETVEQEWIYSGLPKAGQYSIVAFVQSDRPEPGRSEYGQQLFQIHQAGIKSIDKDLQDLVVSGIREEFSSEDVKLVPNPTSDMYFIRFAKPANVPTEWRVYDQLGKVIEQGVAGSGTRELQFSAKEYTQGMYLIYIRQGEKIVQKRLVVVK